MTAKIFYRSVLLVWQNIIERHTYTWQNLETYLDVSLNPNNVSIAQLMEIAQICYYFFTNNRHGD